MDELLFERDGAVEVITFNRPDRLNAVTFDMVWELGTRMEELEYDDEVRAVVITGSGRAFSTGADLAGGGGREDTATPMGMRITTKAYSRTVSAICSLAKPVIGAINGIAAGASLNLALSCDLLVASEEAQFIQVFVRRGLVADAGGTYFLPRLIGLSRAKELMFLGDSVDAARALELGMVSRVVPPDRLMEEAMALARRLAEGPTRAIGMIKDMLNRSFESDLASALDREAAMQGVAASTADVVEGITSFLEKRKPEFKGR